MVELVWTREAELWLKDIHDYIARNNPDAARATVNGIYRRAQGLIDFPESGSIYETDDRTLRILRYQHYRIVYQYDSRRVTIIGVFHGALSIERYLI